MNTVPSAVHEVPGTCTLARSLRGGGGPTLRPRPDRPPERRRAHRQGMGGNRPGEPGDRRKLFSCAFTYAGVEGATKTDVRGESAVPAVTVCPSSRTGCPRSGAAKCVYARCSPCSKSGPGTHPYDGRATSAAPRHNVLRGAARTVIGLADAESGFSRCEWTEDRADTSRGAAGICRRGACSTSGSSSCTLPGHPGNPSAV